MICLQRLWFTRVLDCKALILGLKRLANQDLGMEWYYYLVRVYLSILELIRLNHRYYFKLFSVLPAGTYILYSDLIKKLKQIS